MTGPDRLKTYRAWCEEALEAILPPTTAPPTELHAAMRYSALAPGKRLRPLLVLAAAEAVGANPRNWVEAACAVELVHCFSLIHDDLPAIDNDDLRRGRPTCHIQFGEALALLAGDALFALSFSVLARAAAAPEAVLASTRLLAEAAGSDGLVGGEVADVLAEGQPFDLATLEFIHRRKTGSLIAASCEIGGRLGGGSPAEVEGLRTYGLAIGLAFQVVDDILNETSTPEELGKAAGSDRARAKATYPALIGIDASRELAERLREEALSALPSTLTEVGPLRELAHLTLERTT